MNTNACIISYYQDRNLLPVAVLQGISGLASFANGRTGISFGLEILALAKISLPIAVYDIPFATLHGDDAGNIASSEAGVMHHFVYGPDGVFALIEVMVNNINNKCVDSSTKYICTRWGSWVNRAAVALEELSANSAIITSNYDTRFLRCMSLGVLAIWLKPNKNDDHVIIPLDPTPKKHIGENQYNARTFQIALQAIIKVRLQAASSRE